MLTLTAIGHSDRTVADNNSSAERLLSSEMSSYCPTKAYEANEYMASQDHISSSSHRQKGTKEGLKSVPTLLIGRNTLFYLLASEKRLINKAPTLPTYIVSLNYIIPIKPIIIPIIKTQLLPHFNIPTRHKPNTWLPIITLMNTLWITIILRWRRMIQKSSP